MTTPPAAPTHHHLDAMRWHKTDTDGLDYALLHQNAQGGGTAFLRFQAGTVGRAHRHPAGEELYIVSGRVEVGGLMLGPGDYLYTPPDGVHDVLAHETTVMLLTAPVQPVFL
jgi:quercetin dioxygenase-like cupin family protein